MTLTANRIASRLISERMQKSFVIPRYTPANWFECDVFEVTKSGYFREYEIKMTRADFFADAKKQKNINEMVQVDGRWTFSKVPQRTKHQRVESKDVSGPTQFWFVVPDGLIVPEECPAWAGLICVRVTEDPNYIPVLQRVQAPRLHGKKLDDKVLRHAQGVCYWRFIRLFMKDAARA